MVSSRALHYDMAVHRGIFKNYQITLFRCFVFIPKTGIRFHCLEKKLEKCELTSNS